MIRRDVNSEKINKKARIKKFGILSFLRNYKGLSTTKKFFPPCMPFVFVKEKLNTWAENEFRAIIFIDLII